MISTFVPDESACYDFLDNAVWDSITTESYPSARFSRMVASFCSADNCNANAGPCDAAKKKKGNLFLNMQLRFVFENVPYPVWFALFNASPTLTQPMAIVRATTKIIVS